MLSLVTVSLVITAFHSCYLSHHVFDQVNLCPAWVGIETAIFWQCLPGTVETQRLYLCWAEGTTTIRHVVNFLIRTPVLCSLRMVLLWELIRLCSTPLFTKKIVPVATTRTQKETSNTFKAIVSPQKKLHKCVEYKKGYTRFTCSVGSDRKKKRRNQSNLSRRYKGDNYGSLLLLAVCFLGFVDKIIWIRKDSIFISWFWSDQQDSTSRFRSVRCLCLTTQMSVFPLDSWVYLCRLLI